MKNKTKNKKRRAKGAFTLIELLVVISIIALLLAILMPALGKVKEKAKGVVCKSNLKQWGLIFALYANENEDRLTQSIAGGGISAQDAYWITATLDMYNDKDIRKCPSTKVLDRVINRAYGSTFTAWGPFDPGGGAQWWDDFDAGSYGLNEWATCPPPGTTTAQFWGFNPANAWRTVTASPGNKIPLFMDNVYVDLYPLDTNSPLENDPELTGSDWDTGRSSWGSQAMRLACIDRHNGGINMTFLDMTVRKVGLKELWTLKWHKQFNTHNDWTLPDAEWPAWIEQASR